MISNDELDVLSRCDFHGRLSGLESFHHVALADGCGFGIPKP